VSANDASAGYSGALDASGGLNAFVLSHSNGDALQMTEVKVSIRDPDSGANLATFEDSTWSGVTASPDSSALVNGTAADGLELTVNGNTPDSDTEFGVGDTMTITDQASGKDLVAGEDYNIQIVHIPSESTVVDQTVELN
jgi:hypothetical protein